MPGVVPDPQTAVFWTADQVLQMARVLANDAQASLTGELLATSAPYAWTLLNICYSNLADWMEDSNIESVTYAEGELTLPIGQYNPDPAARCRLSYSEFCDAAGNRYETPTLPLGLLEPLTVWQRNGGSIDSYLEVPQKLGGLPPWWSGGNPSYFGSWEFRENSIYLAGNANGQELRIRFIPSLPPLVQPEDGQPYPLVRLARAGEALAYQIAAEFAEIRNAAGAAILRMKADKKLQVLSNKSAKRSNNSDTRRRGYGFGRRRRGWLL